MVEQRHGQGAPGRPHRRYPEVFNLVSIFTRITDAPKALHRPTPTLKRTQHYLLYQLATDLLNPTIGLKRQKNRKIRSKKHGPLITYEQTEFVPEHPTGIETIGFVFLVRNKNVDFLRK